MNIDLVKSIKLFHEEDDSGIYVEIKSYYIFENRSFGATLIWLDHEGAQLVRQLFGNLAMSGIDTDKDYRLRVIGVDLL